MEELDYAIRESYTMHMLRGSSQYFAINAMADQYRMSVEEIIESLDRTKDKEL